jgi:hypothetical protein
MTGVSFTAFTQDFARLIFSVAHFLRIAQKWRIARLSVANPVFLVMLLDCSGDSPAKGFFCGQPGKTAKNETGYRAHSWRPGYVVWPGGLVSGGERNAVAGAGGAVMGFLEAFSCARCAAAAVCGHPEVASEIAQGSGAALRGFLNLSVSDGFADADVHELLLIDT